MEPALIQELDHPPPSFTNEPERGTESDEVLIPPVPLKPENQNCAVDEWQFVIVAIATTGYNIHSDDICQIAIGAIQDNSGVTVWSEYRLPRQEFHPLASEYNGFSTEDVNGRSELKNVSYGSIPVKTHSKKKVIKSFRDDLRKIADGRPTVIIVYSAQFDLSFLFRLSYLSPSFLKELNIRFLDVLPLVKSMKDK